MTHLSDFSFLSRGIADVCILLWSIMHIYSINKFDALRWKAIKRKEVNSIMTVLFLISVSTLLAYDVISTKIKYEEGYILEPLSKKIIGKPSEYWSPGNKSLRHTAQYVLMVFYAMENTAIFLLQNFWNYLANKITKTAFITTWQFRINYLFVLITLVGFPCIPFIFKSDDNEISPYSSEKEIKEHERKHTYEEVVPELAAASCNLLVIIYGLMAHFKFSALIKQNDKKHITERLKYYKYMNLLLILVVALGASATITISIDGLTEEQYLNKNKFTSDLFVGMINVSTAGAWIILLLIFYPKTLPSYGRYTNDGSIRYSKLSTPAVSPTFEPPKTYKRMEYFGEHEKSGSLLKHSIEIKVDSTTTTSNMNHNLNGGGYIDKNDYDIRMPRMPSPLIPNNRQIVSYASSPNHYQNFI